MNLLIDDVNSMSFLNLYHQLTKWHEVPGFRTIFINQQQTKPSSYRISEKLIRYDNFAEPVL